MSEPQERPLCFLCRQRPGTEPLVVEWAGKRIQFLHDPSNHGSADERGLDHDQVTWDYVPPDGYEPPLVCPSCLHSVQQKDYTRQPGDKQVLAVWPGCLYRHPWVRDLGSSLVEKAGWGEYDSRSEQQSLLIDEIRLARVFRVKDSEYSGSDVRWSWTIAYYAQGRLVHTVRVGDNELYALHAAAQHLVKIQEHTVWMKAESSRRSKAAECPVCGGLARVTGYVGGEGPDDATGVVFECHSSCRAKKGPDGEEGEKALHILPMEEALLCVDRGAYPEEIHDAAWASPAGQRVKEEAGKHLAEWKEKAAVFREKRKIAALQKRLADEAQANLVESTEEDAPADDSMASMVQRMLGGDETDELADLAQRVLGDGDAVLRSLGVDLSVLTGEAPFSTVPEAMAVVATEEDAPPYVPVSIRPLDKPTSAEVNVIAPKSREETTKSGVKVIDRRKLWEEEEEEDAT